MDCRTGTRLAAALTLAMALAAAVVGPSPARAQGVATAQGSAQARKAVRDWARRLLGSLPESIRGAAGAQKRITFQQMDPLQVNLSGRRRQLAYTWMLSALRDAGRIGAFEITDLREHAEVARALENTGDPDWSKRYQEAVRNHRTPIVVTCRGAPEAGGFRLSCTAKNAKLDTLASKDVFLRTEWLSMPLPLDQALESMAGAVAGGLRGPLGAVSVVDQRTGRESPLAKYVADTLRHRVVALRAARPGWSTVGGGEVQEPRHELKGTLFFLADKVELQVMVHVDGRARDAEVEDITVESVSKKEKALGTGRLEPGQTFDDCQVCPEMVVLPPGEYIRGSPANEKGRGRDEGPRRRVRIERTLAVARYEVTRGEYAAFANETGRGTAGHCWVGDGTLSNDWWQEARRSWRSPGFAQGERHPVVCVSWEDAKAYARWLSEKTGKGYRLLSESEWEYAARARTYTARYWGEDATGQCEHANGADAAFGEQYPGENEPRRLSCPDGAAHTAEVGSHGANAFHLSDMLGNVWEWVEDCHHQDYVGAPAGGTAWVEGGDCGYRMLRGGSWYGHSGQLRSAARGSDNPGNRNVDTGFRVVREIAP